MKIYKKVKSEKGVDGPAIYFMNLHRFDPEVVDEVVNCLNLAFEEGYKKARRDIKKVLGIN